MTLNSDHSENSVVNKNPFYITHSTSDSTGAISWDGSSGKDGLLSGTAEK